MSSRFVTIIRLRRPAAEEHKDTSFRQCRVQLITKQEVTGKTEMYEARAQKAIYQTNKSSKPALYRTSEKYST